MCFSRRHDKIQYSRLFSPLAVLEKGLDLEREYFYCFYQVSGDTVRLCVTQLRHSHVGRKKDSGEELLHVRGVSCRALIIHGRCV